MKTDSTRPLATPYFFGASVVGPLHVQLTMPCQDSFAFKTIDEDFAVAAIADGLGSASKADMGAEVAVKSAVESVETAIKAAPEGVDIETLAKDAVTAARRALENKAKTEECSLRDLACTLLVVITLKDSVAAVHIGDGALVVDSDNGLHLITGPGESEYTNEVTPLTSQDWERSIRSTSIISGVNGIALFTDGCQRAGLKKADNSYTPFEGFFRPLFKYAARIDDFEQANQDIHDLLASDKLSEHSEDDKTLVLGILPKGT
ncbi:MAG: PP2C family serine/threonine-protein phosphatase [Candidatus Aquicultor sp.]|nr:PP2C family serine/threonine-protein phosphatase [Candidatus Aquicultor sp.]